MRFLMAFSSFIALCLVGCGGEEGDAWIIEEGSEALSLANLRLFEPVEGGWVSDDPYEDARYSALDGVEKHCLIGSSGASAAQSEANALAAADDCCGGGASAGVARLVTQCQGQTCTTYAQIECIRHDS